MTLRDEIREELEEKVRKEVREEVRKEMQRVDIRRLYKNGVTIGIIAKSFEMSEEEILAIVKEEAK